MYNNKKTTTLHIPTYIYSWVECSGVREKSQATSKLKYGKWYLVPHKKLKVYFNLRAILFIPHRWSSLYTYPAKVIWIWYCWYIRRYFIGVHLIRNGNKLHQINLKGGQTSSILYYSIWKKSIIVIILLTVLLYCLLLKFKMPKIKQ
jgi:hypothetical protein